MVLPLPGEIRHHGDDPQATYYIPTKEVLMLGVKTYEPAFIDRCRAQIDGQLVSFDKLADSAKRDAVDQFSPAFFADLIIVMDAMFVHRLRTVEGKDGNALNEVRMLAESIITNNAVLAANTTIKYKPDNAVLKIAVGDAIHVDRVGFTKLAGAFFDELRRKYT
jgi:hypothetical protein